MVDSAEDTVKDKHKDLKNSILSCIESLDTSKIRPWDDLETKQILSNDINAVYEHNKIFTQILNSYSKNLDSSSEQKKFFKKVFFCLCCCILGITFLMIVAVISIVTYMIFRYQHLSFDINGIYSILGVLTGTFLTTFIVLPYIISKYLFNIREEDNLMTIVNLIKEHDIKIRGNIRNMLKQKNDI